MQHNTFSALEDPASLFKGIVRPGTLPHGFQVELSRNQFILLFMVSTNCVLIEKVPQQV